ncbi:MAG: hypothetical protein ACUVRZ_12505, partial [Desulfobacca sp.]
MNLLTYGNLTGNKKFVAPVSGPANNRQHLQPTDLEDRSPRLEVDKQVRYQQQLPETRFPSSQPVFFTFFRLWKKVTTEFYTLQNVFLFRLAVSGDV